MATAIITDRFVPTAQVMAQVSGMPGHPFAGEHCLFFRTQRPASM